MKKEIGFTHESHKAVTVEWYTPPWIFEQLGCVFDTDVCAPESGVSWIPAKRHISLPTNSLSQEWDGFCWCNPPYGKETALFLEKMLKHNNGIALVFARTDTQWFHNFAAKADSLLFIKGRVQFVDGSGKTKSSGSTCGSVLVGYGEKATNILKNSSVKGFLCKGE